MKKVCIFGCGSWGTALGVHLSKLGNQVSMWEYDQKKANEIIKDGENKEYLPGVIIPPSIKITTIMGDAIIDSEFVIMAVPSHVIRLVSKQIKDILNGQIIVNAAKGIENDSLLTMSQVIKQVIPRAKVVTLSGPSHAEEVGREVPTTIVSACEDLVIAKQVQDLFMSERFRVYTNSDILGVEIGAAIKNIIAMSAGISDGLGYGDNTKAALMTRGLAEISRLGIAMGANPKTFAGLSGVGDLIVTCTSMHSRNRRFGILIGQGKSVEDAQKEVHMVVEGIKTTKSAYQLAQKYDIEMPITNEAYEVLFNNKNAKQAVYDLMMRDKKEEM